MNMTFRWYGEGFDPIPLQHIKQIPGMTGIMGVLSDKAAGEVWGAEEIGALVSQVNAAGLDCEVIESVNVHEDIKMGLPTRDEYIRSYCTTLENLAEHGIKVVIYNFMPVFDWLRTELAHVNEDGSTCLYYDHAEVEGMTPREIVERTARDSNGLTLPGWEPERLGHLDEVMERYQGITREQMRDNYRYFLEGIIPTCERVGIRMAVHPDDPAWDLFGLPRICNTRDDLDRIVRMVDSEANSLCVCSGSLGSNPDNDVPAIFREFGERGRIAAAHVRNVKYLGDKHFQEAPHVSATGDLDMAAIIEAIHDTCPDVYVRPDHGRMIWGETGRPGYPLYDRALGATYLTGLFEATAKLKARA
ncbi:MULTISPECIES: mannonate dehydratase [unclassified Actinomyces]|uniref:mannonate dehydratase n=1 Tax=unclassified Actinomyces TaxID=2609248 RepID=UPI0020181C2A|nr:MULTISPECIES: mannonate dehydratase [unclassified Actinomyces]MCL3778276.1 mannonate dehydratase [Actinomyces sp. AC-20-1]MCL3788738.1 mannonate dehydratase [Actinomyces sp. 187325]MCL3792853.1 mannonate dehydratase [Actinomyces sp. 186855]MCL3794368.1 mannonate dehydratase [Actinomyces sp. 217892]